MIFETHAHYSDKRFDEDREDLLASLPENGIVRVIEVMAGMEDLEPVRNLAEKYSFVYAAAGVHPENVRDLTMEDTDRIREFAKSDRCVAIGEIGLDYYWDKDNPRQQREWFEYQVQIAKSAHLPVIVHSRDAAWDTVDAAKSSRLFETGGVMHCFSYSKEIAKIFLDMGMYLGIGGVVTFKNAKKLIEVVEYAPLNRLLLETDCPYLAPEPFRGKRNCSLYLTYVAERIAQIKGITAEETAEKTMENAVKLFKVS